MTNKTTQNAIRIGTSIGVTLPARDVKRLGIKPGTPIVLDFKVKESVSNNDVDMVLITQKLIERHRLALKNLSQR